MTRSGVEAVPFGAESGSTAPATHVADNESDTKLLVSVEAGSPIHSQAKTCKGTRVRYYIASLKHTNRSHEHIAWWGPEWRGYTPVVGDRIGEYDEATAAKLNDGEDCLAIPVEAVKALLSPEPYWKPGARFYDQPGPVVDNTRHNWNALIAASLKAGRKEDAKPRPEVFRGTRRSFAMEGGS